MTATFKKGDLVRIRGMGDVFPVHEAPDDDIVLMTPYGRIFSIDYRGLEHVPDNNERRGVVKGLLMAAEICEAYAKGISASVSPVAEGRNHAAWDLAEDIKAKAEELKK